MWRFVHAADVHLDSPLRGLERYEGAPVGEIRGATRRALENLVALAVEEKAHAVLLVGDLYDGDWRDYNTGLFFSRQMGRLREAGIRVMRLTGNHDAASEITRHLKLPDNVVDLPIREPGTVKLDEVGAVVHGQGFAERAVTRNLVERYPAAVRGAFNIGMLHTSLGGREGHERYAPCTEEDLLAREYDYWALGHVHRREVVRREPWIVFPGNTQGRHVREEGGKGCSLVTVEGNRVTSVEHRELDVLRWRLCRLDASRARDGEAVLERAIGSLQRLLEEEPGRPLAVRLEVVGACRAHGDLSRSPEKWVQQLRADAANMSAGRLWLEKVRFDTRSELSLEQLRVRDDVYGGLVRAIQSLGPEDPVLEVLRQDWQSLRAKLPPEALGDGEVWEDMPPERLAALREELAWFLLPRLLGGSEAA